MARDDRERAAVPVWVRGFPTYAEAYDVALGDLADGK